MINDEYSTLSWVKISPKRAREHNQNAPILITAMANKFKQPAQAQTKSNAKSAAPQKKVAQMNKSGKK